jgi:gamma-glutamylcyclotransferase (GGCT)/AIG2-like uncharacterized protein YtfP
MNQSLAIKVFVYGTLKPGEANYHRYCQGKIITQTPAYTFGSLYSLPLGYPAMTKGKNRVWGFLLEFGDSEILRSLDRLEDYQEQRASDLNLYYRSLTLVYSIDNLPIARAWTYYMQLERVIQYGGTKVTSGNWKKI